MHHELKNDEIYVSRQTAQYALYSGQLFIFAAIFACFMKHYYFTLALFCLYVSTMLFWTQICTDNDPYVKIIDSIIAFSALIFFIIYGSKNYFKPGFKPLVYAVFVICLTVFFINEAIYYFTVKTDNKYSKISNIDNREFINQATVFSHIIFIHILPVSTYFYCALGSL
jgi:hypothetical protein